MKLNLKKIIILSVVVILISFLCYEWFIFKINNNRNQGPLRDSSKLTEQSSYVELKMDNKYKLIDNLTTIELDSPVRITLNQKSTYDPNLSYFKLRKLLSFYNNGFQHTVTLDNCNYKDYLDQDVYVKKIVNCFVKIESKKEYNQPKIAVDDFSIKLDRLQNDEINRINAGKYFVSITSYVMYANKFFDGRIEGGFLEINLSTSFGNGRLVLTNNEIKNKIPGSVTIGPLKVDVQIDEPQCGLDYGYARLTDHEECRNTSILLNFSGVDKNEHQLILSDFE